MIGEAEPGSPMVHEEAVVLYGRAFTFRFYDRPDLQRVEVEILEGSGAQARRYVRVRVRGRTTDEARDRAVDVLHHHAGLDRYLALVQRAVDRLAPGSRLDVSENAREIQVDLRGPWALDPPLILVREDAVDPERTDEELTAFIEAHLRAYLHWQG